MLPASSLLFPCSLLLSFCLLFPCLLPATLADEACTCTTTEEPRSLLDKAFAKLDELYCGECLSMSLALRPTACAVKAAANVSRMRLLRLQSCDDLIQGKATAALKRICMTASTRNRSRDLLFLKSLWCAADNSQYRQRVESCIKFQWRTMPLKPWRERLPFGTMRSARLALSCYEKHLNVTLL